MLNQLGGPATVAGRCGQLAPQLVGWQAGPPGRPPGFDGAAVDALHGQVIIQHEEERQRAWARGVQGSLDLQRQHGQRFVHPAGQALQVIPPMRHQCHRHGCQRHQPRLVRLVRRLVCHQGQTARQVQHVERLERVVHRPHAGGGQQVQQHITTVRVVALGQGGTRGNCEAKGPHPVGQLSGLQDWGTDQAGLVAGLGVALVTKQPRPCLLRGLRQLTGVQSHVVARNRGHVLFGSGQRVNRQFLAGHGKHLHGEGSGNAAAGQSSRGMLLAQRLEPFRQQRRRLLG